MVRNLRLWKTDFTVVGPFSTTAGLASGGYCAKRGGYLVINRSANVAYMIAPIYLNILFVETKLKVCEHVARKLMSYMRECARRDTAVRPHVTAQVKTKS